MSNKFLYDKLLDIKEEKLTSFFVPGHKNGNLLKTYFPGNIGAYDVTEIPGTDNLHEPESAIRHSQERAANLYGCKKSYFLVGGTTCGILSMIMGTTKPGDKVIVVRDCHKSVLNAIKIGHLEPVYIMPHIDRETGLSFGVTEENLKQVLEQNQDAKAVILTYPTYHGVCTDIRAITAMVHDYNMLMLVDEAHGAHLFLSDQLPPSSLTSGADIVVHSTHKSMPSFTQSSILHVNSDRINISRVEEMLQIHQTTSPSYLLMASLDLAMEIASKDGRALMTQLLSQLSTFEKRIEAEGIKILTDHYVKSKGDFSLDPTKVTVLSRQSNIDTNYIEDHLRRGYGIQCEYSNHRICLFVSSIANEADDFLMLCKALMDCRNKRSQASNYLLADFVPELVLKPSEAMYRESKVVDLIDSEGMISGDNIVPYPPGIPIIIPGERITRDIISFVEMSLANGIRITGLDDLSRIRVIE